MSKLTDFGKARRETTNGLGDPLGDVGTIIQTPTRDYNGAPGHAPDSTEAPRNKARDWEEYSGKYYVPDRQTITRFSFRSIRGNGSTSEADSTSGNLVDDISFVICYPIRYNANGGSGTLPDPQSNNYSGYHREGATYSLTSVVPTRPGYTFLGWCPSRLDPVGGEGALDGVEHYDSSASFRQPGRGVTLYAIWAKNPTVTTYVVVGEKVTKIGSTTLAYGSTLDCNSSSWLDGQMSAAVGAGGLPAGTQMDGWWTSSSCSGAKAGKLTIWSSVSLYVKPLTSTVRYYRDGESTPVYTETVYRGARHTASASATSAAKRGNCTPGLLAWYKSWPSTDYATASKAAKYTGQTIAGDLSLYARNYATLRTSLVDPVENGAQSALSSKVYAYGTRVTLSSDAWVRSQLSGAQATAGLPSGAQVEGWWTSSSCSGAKATSVTMSSDHTIWCAAISAEVRYFVDTATTPILTEPYYVGATYRVNERATSLARRPNCTPGLAAWYTDPNDRALTADEPGEGGQSRFTSGRLPSGGLDLYGVNRGTITFELTGDSERLDPDGPYREGPGDDYPSADTDLPDPQIARVDRPTRLPSMDPVFEPIGDGRWRTITPSHWHRDAGGGDTPLSCTSISRDTTLYLRWEYRTADGIVDRRG